MKPTPWSSASSDFEPERSPSSSEIERLRRELECEKRDRTQMRAEIDQIREKEASKNVGEFISALVSTGVFIAAVYWLFATSGGAELRQSVVLWSLFGK